MTPAPDAAPQPLPPLASAAEGRAARWLRRLVLAGAAAMLVVLVPQPFRASSLLAAAPAGPLAVVLTGLAFLLPPSLLIASWVAGSRVRLPHPWLTLPVGLMLIGAGVSTALAADRSSALVRAAETGALWIAFWSLAQALRTGAERRFLLAALVATASLGAVLALVQATGGHAVTVPAALLVLGAIVAIGLAAEKWTTRGARGLAAVASLAATLCVAGLACAWRPATAALRGLLDVWRATLPVLRHDGLTGVGLENFGLHYVTYRSPAAPLDAHDPHNLWLAAWSQLGLAGLLAVGSLIVVAIRAWCRRTPTPATTLPTPDAPTGHVVGLAALAALLAAPAVILFFPLGPRAGAVAIGLVALATVLAAAESPRHLTASDRPLGILRAACVAAVAIFWIADQFGAATLAPTTAWAMFLVLAASLGPGRAADPARERPPLGPVPKFFLMGLAMVGCYGYALGIVSPVARQTAYMQMAAQMATPADRDDWLRCAAEANPLAWEPDFLRGQVWEAAASETGADVLALERAMAAYDAAAQRQPHFAAAYVALARCRLSALRATEDAQALEAARGWLATAVRLAPTDLTARLLRAGVLDQSRDAASAIQEYEEVLKLDRLMPEGGRRLSEGERGRIEERLQCLKDALATQPGGS